MSKFTSTNQPEQKGRKQGSKNKIGSEVKELVETYLESNFERFNTSMGKLRPKDYVTAYLKLLRMVLPRQIDAHIDYNQLSDEDLDQIVTKILTSNAENRKETDG